MRSQCAIYVDAGYLLAAAATRVTGTSLRSAVDVDHATLVTALIDQAHNDCELPVLRVNWYDSGNRPGGLPDWAQEQIGIMPRVKLRLGRRSLSGEQKGVDLRIGLDLATQGRQRVVDVMYLVSGDDDLTEAVEEAQSHGVQVTLLAVPGQSGRPHAVAKHLQRAADGLLLIDSDKIDAAVRSRAIPVELLPKTPDEATATADAAASTPLTGEPGTTGTVGTEPQTPTSAPAVIDAQSTDVPAPVTPSIFASKRSTTLLPPKAGPPLVRPPADGQLGTAKQTIPPEDIDAVARQVVGGWCRAATPGMLQTLKAGRPSIPGDLDRALLMDLSNLSEVDDIPEGARYALRERFWSLVDQVRVG